MVLRKTNWGKYGGYEDSFLMRLFLNRIWAGYDKLLSGVNLKSGIKILELGAGSGYNSLNLAVKFKASKVVLVDFNDNALKSSRNRFKGRFNSQFLKKDVFDLNINGKFDIVHSQGLIEHFQGRKLKELLRIHLRFAKKNGLIILIYPTPTISYRIIRKLAEIAKKWIFADEVPLRKEQLINLMSENNVELINSTRIHCGITEDGLLFMKK